jgi:hypothetical protein
MRSLAANIQEQIQPVVMALLLPWPTLEIMQRPRPTALTPLENHCLVNGLLGERDRVSRRSRSSLGWNGQASGFA